MSFAGVVYRFTLGLLTNCLFLILVCRVDENQFIFYIGLFFLNDSNLRCGDHALGLISVSINEAAIIKLL